MLEEWELGVKLFFCSLLPKVQRTVILPQHLLCVFFSPLASPRGKCCISSYILSSTGPRPEHYMTGSWALCLFTNVFAILRRTKVIQSLIYQMSLVSRSCWVREAQKWAWRFGVEGTEVWRIKGSHSRQGGEGWELILDGQEETLDAIHDRVQILSRGPGHLNLYFLHQLLSHQKKNKKTQKMTKQNHSQYQKNQRWQSYRYTLLILGTNWLSFLLPVLITPKNPMLQSLNLQMTM